MAVTQTSMDAYQALDLQKQEMDVLRAIAELGETCIADCATYLNMERSTVAGRFNGLKKKKAIIYIGDKKSSRTGIKSEFWRVRNFKQELF